MNDAYTPLLTLFAIFIVIYLVSLVIPLKNYGLEVSPIYILYKTDRFNNILKRIADTNKRFWKAFGNLGMIVGVLEMFLAIYFLAINLQRFLYVPAEASPIVPVLPGITIGFRWFPYILISFGLAIITHESAHGILSFLENIPVKSSGLLFAPITFGAFVEPNEELFNNSPLRSKLRVISVGSMANIITGMFLLILMIGLFIPSSGVLVMNVPDGTPAYLSGMRAWDVIYSINGQGTPNLQVFSRFLLAIGPNVPLTIETSRGVRYLITEAASNNASRGILGVSDLLTYSAMRVGEVNSQLSYNLYLTFNWSYLLMINVAIFNMFPLFPFDGEAFIFSILKSKLKKRLNGTRIALNIFFLLLFASNIGLSFLRYGFTFFS